jgi:hypothetical protein
MAEVYRFTWDSSFGGDAVARIGGKATRSRCAGPVAGSDHRPLMTRPLA